MRFAARRLPRARRWGPPINLSLAERVVRIVAGLLVGLLGLLGWPVEVHGAAGLAVAVVTVLAVLDLTISGLIGYCPLHRFVSVPSATGKQE